MAETTRYAVGDKLSLVDLNGKMYRVVIDMVGNYAVTHQLTNVEIAAQQYPPPNDTINPETTMFYLCSNIPGDSAEFMNLILWDQILDHTKTVYLTEKVVYRLDILPLPPISGQPMRDIDAIILDIKNAIASAVPDVSVGYTDITNESKNELERVKSAVKVAEEFLGEFQELESIRPLIAELRSIDFQNLTTDVMGLLAAIQARLSIIDAGGANLASTA